MPKKSSTASIPKPRAEPSRKRKLVKRELPAAPGAGRIIVVKKGEDLRAGIQSRLDAMKADYETIEFFWTKIITSPDYASTREYPEHSQKASLWELREGVKNFQEYKTKMKRFKVLVDHFQEGFDYELTIDEVVEILS